MKSPLFRTVFILWIFFSTPVLSQEVLAWEPVDTIALKEQMRSSGTIRLAITWHDTEGRHLLVLYETGILAEPGSTLEVEGYYRAELYAYHYLEKENEWALQWKVYDYVKECPVDITAGFTESPFRITDLDGNSQTEVWLVYKTGCRGDISGDRLKVIMYEGDKKHAMRGEETVMTLSSGGNSEILQGHYNFDKAFEQAPDIMRDFACQLWEQYGTRRYE